MTTADHRGRPGSPASGADRLDEPTLAQLAVLDQVGRLLAPVSVRWWLRGGWAIDFLVGSITRPHADLDLVLWTRHRRRAQQALLAADCQLVRETARQVDRSSQGQELSLVFLTRREDGTIVTDGIPAWTWRSDALSRRRYRLHGISARVVNAQQLLDEKQGYARGTGRPPRPKDLASMALLRQLLGGEPCGTQETERISQWQ